MIVSGILPIDQMRGFTQPVSLVGRGRMCYILYNLVVVSQFLVLRCASERSGQCCEGSVEAKWVLP